ncbi:hypothetical protein [Bacillus cereus]|uniref:hypothetical protein n=1 Tax=Bacillus cereus TaxID=1396 RepID=UPI00211D4D62|nr:hypothetical protein [Bacillus cereus]
MKPGQYGKYGREYEMVQTGRHHPDLFEGAMQSAATIDDPEQVQSSVSFCSMVHVPQGFVYVPKGTRKFAYSLPNLSVVKDTCQKTIAAQSMSR